MLAAGPDQFEIWNSYLCLLLDWMFEILNLKLVRLLARQPYQFEIRNLYLCLLVNWIVLLLLSQGTRSSFFSIDWMRSRLVDRFSSLIVGTQSIKRVLYWLSIDWIFDNGPYIDWALNVIAIDWQSFYSTLDFLLLVVIFICMKMTRGAPFLLNMWVIFLCVVLDQSAVPNA